MSVCCGQPSALHETDTPLTIFCTWRSANSLTADYKVGCVALEIGRIVYEMVKYNVIYPDIYLSVQILSYFTLYLTWVRSQLLALKL